MDANRKCTNCENYDKENKRCRLGKNCNADFFECTDYLINEKLVHF